MSKSLNIVLCWHMHQPYYRDGLDGDYQLPWVYLHGIKDYADMAAHLERYPEVHAVVNFVPILLEQLDDYAGRLQRFLEHGDRIGDSLLDYLAGSRPVPEDREGRIQLVKDCRRVNLAKMVQPYPAFRALSAVFDGIHDEGGRESHDFCLDYLNEQFFVDLLVWYHLAWMGYSLRQRHDVRDLMDKASHFTRGDRRRIISIIQETLGGLIPRYRALKEKGQIELSMTPWGHPIIPLLNNLGNMRDTQPGEPMPNNPAYPGGVQRSRWHLRKGLEVFEHYFGCRPQGVWLSEGAISSDAVALLEELDIEWTASGEAVWRHSCHISQCDPAEMDCRKALFLPYRLQDFSRPRIFFRDDGLSDLIGFEYRTWHADDAVANLMHNLENVQSFLGEEADRYVVSIIMDGENAWEYYPENGHFFLDSLYKNLSRHPALKTRRFAGLDHGIREERLNALVSGSWVYGSFSTWIGSPDKNHAWDMLIEAKMAYDEVMASGRLEPSQAELVERQLGICESSDWFWWFGDYNAADSVNDFDRLFRLQLKNLYELLGLVPPPSLDHPVSLGSATASDNGAMRRNT